MRKLNWEGEAVRVSELYQWATVGAMRLELSWGNSGSRERYVSLPYADRPRTTMAIKAWMIRRGSRRATISARSFEVLFQDVKEVAYVRRR